MPKGRHSAPSTERDGTWFVHRGHDGTPTQHATTTTKLLQNSFNDSEAAKYPPKPPKEYLNKDTGTFSIANQFSAHANRHSLQDHAVYFGNGRDTRTLGKQLTAPVDRQHYTDNQYLTHQGNKIYEYSYSSIYNGDYRGDNETDTPNSRRYPRSHKTPSPGLSKLTTDTSRWYKDSEQKPEFKTSTETLGVSIKPYEGKNKWKYSNHGLPKLYPPYTPSMKPKINPEWFMKGKDFMAVPDHKPYDMHGRVENRLYA